MRKLRTLILALLSFMACSQLPYKDDLGFLVSAEANSPEFPVFIGGGLCKDSSGTPGLCALRVTNTQTLAFSIDAQPYAYMLQVSCSKPIVIPDATIPANTPFTFSVTPDQFVGMKAFTCIGEVSPQDRAQPLSAEWEVRVKVVDSAYEAREQVLIVPNGKKKTIVFGQYARITHFFDGEKWSVLNKTTTLDVKDPSSVKAYSESFQMRYNYYGF